MPKVLRIINRFNLGGITYNVSYLSRYMAPEYETMLIGGKKLITEESSEFIAEGLGLKPVIIESMSREINWLEDLRSYDQIRRIIREFKPDIVHTHAAKAGALGRKAALAEKVPVLVHTFHGHVFHSYFNSLKTALIKNIERRLAKKTNAIIALSEKQKQELVEIHKICPAEKVRVIPLGFDLNRFRSDQEEHRKAFRDKLNISEDTIVVTTAGRLVPVKNHELFLRGIAKLKSDAGMKILGLIAGDGERMNALKEYAAHLGLSEKDILFLSWVKETEKLYAGSDIIAMTSFNEGTPVSLIEAQASGKPVIASATGGVENVVSIQTGILFDVQDETAFYSGLLKLAKEPVVRRTMGAAGWENVGKRFHYSRLVEDMKELYSRLLSRTESSAN